jgi:hypothetical protein
MERFQAPHTKPSSAKSTACSQSKPPRFMKLSHGRLRNDGFPIGSPSTYMARPLQEPQAGSGTKMRQHMSPSFMSGLLAGIVVGLIGVTQGVGQELCRPRLAIKEVQFPEMRLPALRRTWTAVVSVDASRCAANSAGHFEIRFSRLKEMGIDIEFSEEFVWLPPSVTVSVDFWIDEAVERYWIDNVSTCPCAR